MCWLKKQPKMTHMQSPT